MYLQLFQHLGLSKNEAKIYGTLLESGELGVGIIAARSKIHRRNVYDALNRLLEKGLVVEILRREENLYQAVDPKKLTELVQEGQDRLNGIMPQLEQLYRQPPEKQEVFIYRGIEGWKNYMRDILRVREDFYCFGGKGAWMDKELSSFFPRFFEEAKRVGIKYHHLFDHEVKDTGHPIVNYVAPHYKFLPRGFSTSCSFDVFGPHVNIISDIFLGGVRQDFSFTVVVNQKLADSFRNWFRFIWEHYTEQE